LLKVKKRDGRSSAVHLLLIGLLPHSITLTKELCALTDHCAVWQPYLLRDVGWLLSVCFVYG